MIPSVQQGGDTKQISSPFRKGGGAGGGFVLAVAALFFIIATSVLTITNRLSGPLRTARFDWPDEMATAYFAERIADGLPIAAHDDTIALLANRLHPRSVNVRDSSLVPGGFLGFPILLGLVGIWFGFGASFLVTPLLAVVGVFSLLCIVRRVFDDKTAVLTGLLAFTNPALLYYTSYVMLPNVAFVSLALAGAALLMSRRWNFAGGLLIGLALFIRPNEIIWLLPIASLIPPLTLPPGAQKGETKKLSSPFREGGGWRWGIPLLGFSLGFAPTFIANLAVFGHPFATGYSRFASDATTASPLEFSGSMLLPFGINVKLILSNLWNSSLKLFWWIVIPAATGIVIWWRSHTTTLQRRYTLTVLIMSLWLVIYYGSWPFTDVEILNLNTIGRSYVRYWLPAFLLFSPFVAIALRRVGRYASVAACIVMTLLSIRLVYWSRPESIVPVAKRISKYHLIMSDVRDIIPANSVVITERTDKIVFPERRVAETDLSQGFDAVLASVVFQNDLPWYLLARVSDDKKRAIVASLPGRRLMVESGWGPWGWGIELLKIVHL